jgi:predicted dehydrogenase
VNVGIVGCGVISRTYAGNAAAFDAFELVACADVDPAAAQTFGTEHGLEVASVDGLIADPSIAVVLNLTPPVAHAMVTRQALAAGKHVYTEKPLATTAAEASELVADADRRGLRIGCAPDIFLGAAYQAARRLIDEGAIGAPLSVSAAMLAGGQTTWHPNADIFYADGAGPLLDMGPYYLTAIVTLLGEVRRVAGFSSTRVVERTIEIGPRTGELFTAATPTHTAALLELDGDVTAGIVASFEAPGRWVSELVIQGSEGALGLPDPNAFGGHVRIQRGRGSWSDVAYDSFGAMDTRGLGLQDLVEALGEGRPHRAGGHLARHVVEVARAVLTAADEGRAVDIVSHVERPAPMPDARLQA